MANKRKEYPEAARMYESGLSVQDVAAFYGVTRQAMWEWLKRRGVTMRPRVQTGKRNHFHRGGRKAEKRAHGIVERALAKGVLARPTHCEACGSVCVPANNRPQIEAHHDDYTKPLAVTWLCRPCHFQKHQS